MLLLDWSMGHFLIAIRCRKASPQGILPLLDRRPRLRKKSISRACKGQAAKHCSAMALSLLQFLPPAFCLGFSQCWSVIYNPDKLSASGHCFIISTEEQTRIVSETIFLNQKFFFYFIHYGRYMISNLNFPISYDFAYLFLWLLLLGKISVCPLLN